MTHQKKISFNNEERSSLTFDSKIKPFWNPSIETEKQMQEIADQIREKNKDKDFDCIIGMSGGIDSSYLVYLAKEKLNLRPLVFHVDAGWNSDIAVNNIEQLVSKLNLDLYTEVIDWDEIRDLQLSFIKSGVPHIDTPQDHAFFAVMYKFANEHNINHIPQAQITYECIRNPKEWMYYQTIVSR